MQQIQPDRKNDAETRVHKDIHHQVSADALCRLIQRLGHQVQSSHSGQQQQPVPQVLPLQQHVDRKDQHHPQCAQRLQHRHQQLAQVSAVGSGGVTTVTGVG